MTMILDCLWLLFMLCSWNLCRKITEQKPRWVGKCPGTKHLIRGLRVCVCVREASAPTQLDPEAPWTRKSNSRTLHPKPPYKPQNFSRPSDGLPKLIVFWRAHFCRTQNHTKPMDCNTLLVTALWICWCSWCILGSYWLRFWALSCFSCSWLVLWRNWLPWVRSRMLLDRSLMLIGYVWALLGHFRGSTQRKSTREGFFGGLRAIWRVFLGESFPCKNVRENNQKTIKNQWTPKKKLKTLFSLFYVFFSVNPRFSWLIWVRSCI